MSWHDITIKAGDRTITIGNIRDPDAARVQIAQMAATVAAGIEAGSFTSDWDSDQTVGRALHIATEIFIATRHGL